MRIQLSTNDAYTIVNALRVAADQYDRDAKTAHDAGPQFSRTFDQFKKQAEQARELAQSLEDTADGE